MFGRRNGVSSACLTTPLTRAPRHPGKAVTRCTARIQGGIHRLELLKPHSAARGLSSSLSTTHKSLVDTMTSDPAVCVTAVPGSTVPPDIPRHIVSYLSTTDLLSAMRTSKAMHDAAAPYLYPVMRVSPERSASLKQKLNPAPRWLSLVRRLEFYARPWGETSVWATCSPRVLRIDDCYGYDEVQRCFSTTQLETVIVQPLRFPLMPHDRCTWYWMGETALRVIYVCANPVDLDDFPPRPGQPTPPDYRIGPKTKSLTIVFTPK